MGAPQGTVLFTLHILDFQYSSESCLQKYSDDYAVVECISDGREAEYRELVYRFAGTMWEQSSHVEHEHGSQEEQRKAKHCVHPGRRGRGG